MLLVGFISCEKPGNSQNNEPKDVPNNKEPETSYPVSIPFTEYSLPETCQWKNFESNNVIVINSDNELNDYIICTDDNYLKIDFSKYSLLLARGWVTSGIHYIDVDFLKNTASEYILNATIHTNMTAAPATWIISIITPKIGDEATISLNVQQKND